MVGALTGTTSWLELTWTVVALAGLIFSAWLSFAGWLDLSAVRAAIRDVPPRARIFGPRWYVGLTGVVDNSALCLVWIGFIVIGLLAMRYPPPPPTTEQAVSNQWVGWLLIMIEMLLVLVQGWRMFIRMKIEHAIAHPPDWDR